MALSAEDVAHFREFGYVVVRGAYQPKRVAELRGAAERYLARDPPGVAWLQSDKGQAGGGAGQRVLANQKLNHLLLPDKFDPVYAEWLAEDALPHEVPPPGTVRPQHQRAQPRARRAPRPGPGAALPAPGQHGLEARGGGLVRLDRVLHGCAAGALELGSCLVCGRAPLDQGVGLAGELQKGLVRVALCPRVGDAPVEVLQDRCGLARRAAERRSVMLPKLLQSFDAGARCGHCAGVDLHVRRPGGLGAELLDLAAKGLELAPKGAVGFTFWGTEPEPPEDELLRCYIKSAKEGGDSGSWQTYMLAVAEETVA